MGYESKVGKLFIPKMSVFVTPLRNNQRIPVKLQSITELTPTNESQALALFALNINIIRSFCTDPLNNNIALAALPPSFVQFIQHPSSRTLHKINQLTPDSLYDILQVIYQW